MPNPWDKDPVVPWAKDPLAKSTSFIQDPINFAIPKRSVREEKIAKRVMLTPAEQEADLISHYSPESFAELEKEIKNQKDPKARQILLEERSKFSFSNMLGISNAAAVGK